jgi:hypothetical protein
LNESRAAIASRSSDSVSAGIAMLVTFQYISWTETIYRPKIGWK